MQEKEHSLFFSKIENKKMMKNKKDSIMKQPVAKGEECLIILIVSEKASNNDENIHRD